MKRLQQNGFTLIEVMVTVVIVAIMLAIAVPSFTETLERRRVVGTANELSADLQYTRSLAVSRQTDTYVASSVTGYTIALSGESDAHKTVTLPASLSFSTGGTVTFGSLNGTSNTATYTISSSKSPFQATVSTNVMGRVQLNCSTTDGKLSSASC
jgi:type IV fimbrial biogenesis protein FimT